MKRAKKEHRLDDAKEQTQRGQTSVPPRGDTGLIQTNFHLGQETARQSAAERVSVSAESRHGFRYKNRRGLRSRVPAAPVRGSPA